MFKFSLRYFYVLLILGITSSPLQASTILVTSETTFTGGGLIDWGSLSSTHTQIPQPLTIDVQGIPGLTAQISQNAGRPFLTHSQGGTINGDYAVLERLLGTGAGDVVGPGPISLLFSSSIRGVGAQIQSFFYGPFTASIEAFDRTNSSLGVFNVQGVSSDRADDSAPFIGILSDKNDISRVNFGVPIAIGRPQDFLISSPFIQVNGQVNAVPEPTSFLLFVSGFVVLFLIAWRQQISS
jgi:hypothetical protein